MKISSIKEIYYNISIIILLINNCFGYTQIKIGAIFFKNEVDLEQAFTLSITSSNRKFYDVRIVPIIRYTTADDSIILEKLACELISNGTMAIFGPSSKASSDIVEAICNYVGVPHIKFDWNHDETFEEKSFHKMTLNVYPSLQALTRAYSDIITNFGWKQFTIIYDNDMSLIRLQNLLELYPAHKTGISKVRIEDDDLGIIWKTVKYNQAVHFVIDCNPNLIEKLLKASKDFNMTDPYIGILFINLDTHTVDLRQHYGKIRSNITAIKISVNEQAVLTQEQSLSATVLFDAVQLFSNALQYLIRFQQVHLVEPKNRCDHFREVNPREQHRSHSWNLGTQLLNTMKNVQMVFDDQDDILITRNMKFNDFGERTDFNLDIYKPMRLLTLATWGPNGKIEPYRSAASKTTQNIDLEADADIERRNFRVAGRLGTPYLMEREAKEGEILTGNQRYEGYSVDLIHKLAIELDFDYTIEIVADNQWGKLDAITGEWNGIIRELIDHKADIGICDLTITHERRQAVDFTVPFMQLGISILFFKEPPKSPELFSFLKPFALEVWMYMMTAFLVLSILFFFLARIAAGEYENPHPCNPNPEELESNWIISNVVWLTIGSLVGQGCDFLPRTTPLRVVNALWWFFALMMLNSYIANLAAFLTTAKQQSSIGSIDDLANQNKISFGTVSGGSTSTFFKESNDSVYRLAWSKMISTRPIVFTNNNDEGLDRVKKSKGYYAFLMETTGLEYITERNCQVQQIGEQIGEKHYGIAVPLGAEYRSNLSVAILKLSEKGELFSLKKKWWKTHNVTCEKFAAGGNNELGIKNVGGVFLVLGVGLLVAHIIGIIEFLWNVQQVAIEKKISPKRAFKEELSFALKFWIQKKPVQCNETISFYSQSRRSSRSRSQSQNRNVNIFPISKDQLNLLSSK